MLGTPDASGPLRTMTGLNELDVVRAGRLVAERVGARALTMRMLAAELGVSTMAAYRHVVSKTELLALIADDILSGVTIPSREDGAWDARLEVLESSAFSQISRVADLWDLLPQGRILPAELRLNGVVADILLSAGFEPLSAAWAQEAIFGYVFGQVRLRMRVVSAGLADDRDGHRSRTDQAETQAHFLYGLRIMLAGLRKELEGNEAASHGVRQRSALRSNLTI
jgi:AcrR family transcriptional regulator